MNTESQIARSVEVRCGSLTWRDSDDICTFNEVTVDFIADFSRKLEQDAVIVGNGDTNSLSHCRSERGDIDDQSGGFGGPVEDRET